MEFEIKALINLAPITQEYLHTAPLPHPRKISNWYDAMQEWCIAIHKCRPSRNQIAEQLGLLGYQRRMSDGQLNWFKDA